MEYEIWHDEYKGDDSVNEYWHGILFIPLKNKSLILEKLKSIRDQHEIDYANEVKFAGSLESSSRSRLVYNQLQLFIHSLIVKEREANTFLYNRDGKKKYEKNFKHFETLNGVWGCKFVLMKIPDNHKKMKKYSMTYADRVETTFRFALKGGLHYLFTKPIKIIGFYFDGHEHHNRKIEINRITKGDFWQHVSFSSKVFIDDRQRKDRDETTKMILSVIDNAVGGLSAKLNYKKDLYDTLYPLEAIISRAKNHTLDSNKNGRWYKSLSLSQMIIVGENIDFKNIFHNPEQASFFDVPLG